ncbi:hypothetical protein Tco_1539902 [Tanacetum coccineum]
MDTEGGIDKATPLVDVTNSVIPVTCDDDEAEITDECLNYKENGRKGSSVEGLGFHQSSHQLDHLGISLLFVFSDTRKLPRMSVTHSTHHQTSAIWLALQSPQEEVLKRLRPLPQNCFVVSAARTRDWGRSHDDVLLLKVIKKQMIDLISGTDSYASDDDEILTSRPFHMGTVSDVIAGGTKGAVQQGPIRARVLNDLSAEEKDRYKADIHATNILLQGIPKDIYSLINHYTDAKDIWENVKMILEGETIQGYYVRFTKLINDMRNIKMTMPRMQLNSKFVNNMLPEWSRFITEVKLNRGLKESNFDQLYAYLKQHECRMPQFSSFQHNHPSLLNPQMNHLLLTTFNWTQEVLQQKT